MAQERKESERRAVTARDQLLSDITKMLYGYNMTVNVNTGKYTIIKGNGMEHTVAYLQAHDQYDEVYQHFCQNTDVLYRSRAVEMLSLDNYRGRIEEPGLVGTEEFLEHLPDGSDAWHEMNVIVGFDREGDPILHILGRDVTEAHEKADTKAQLEIANAANAAKSAFLFNMSHDIRTPMNAIIGFRDLLEKHQEEPEKRADYLRKIEDASNVLLSIINNVLEMARIEKGTLEIDETAWSAE
ncbi:MAG: histidine kinase dimerization/phospho-acceptor domain-containing protein [Candidatus Limivivens sp.]|nr:histidine kinase dimerization/phospho-acceptor domain-containing protein [Candidatus Limivivens sp.]